MEVDRVQLLAAVARAAEEIHRRLEGDGIQEGEFDAAYVFLDQHGGSPSGRTLIGLEIYEDDTLIQWILVTIEEEAKYPILKVDQLALMKDFFVRWRANAAPKMSVEDLKVWEQNSLHARTAAVMNI